MKTVLAVVVSGSAYESFAEDLFMSAEEFFRPTNDVEFLMLPGRSGWPAATMYRHHVLIDNFPDADYVFLSDADMVFQGDVWNEVLPKRGITATLHPGYVETPPDGLPYERNPASRAYMPNGAGRAYFCGGFIGGTHDEMFLLSASIAQIIDADMENGHIPVWHDESALNWCLSHKPPQVVLPPEYCYPQNDSWYRTFWRRDYKPKLVAIDKTEEQRGAR